MKNTERFIENIEITKLHPFEGNPYKVRDDADMESLEESISEQGIAMPLLVRPLENAEGEYEIISGHRRLFAARRLGLKEVPVIVYDISREDAIVMLVDSNLFREHVLPSEKAFAYKMKLEAMNRQGYRSDLTSTQVGSKFRTNEMVGEQNSESREQIRRYIRLTQLIGELLILVDEGKIAFTPAVELSFLTEQEQRTVLDHVVLNDCTHSLSQANRMKKLSQEGKLTSEEIQKIMSEEKANQREMFKVPVAKIEKYVPKANRKQLEDFVLKACEYYAKYLIKQKERER
ncbi:MAG: ParB/RepB/Spo0J family partition protein [Oscillospiraceae bacterium]|nr:ParB/RepB/Spo0J family partition protein [Oscillospiraceae bacterium]